MDMLAKKNFSTKMETNHKYVLKDLSANFITSFQEKELLVCP